MRKRIAQRIVQRVQSSTATAVSYPRWKVEAAFEKAGVELTPDLMEPWTFAEAEAERIRAELIAAAPSVAERKARKDAAAQARIQAIEEKRMTFAAKRAAEVQESFAIAAGQVAFKEAMANEIEELPDDVSLERDSSMKKAEDPERDLAIAAMKEQHRLAGLRVDELKAIAKERGLSGYSKMKKEDLLILLTTDR